MKAPALDSIVDRQAQTFVLCAITIALTAGPIGFEFGAYHTLFVNRVYNSWLLVTAALVAMALVPKERLPFPKSRLTYLIIPSLWITLRILVPVDNANEVTYPLLFLLGTISCVLCIPYCIYLLLRLMNPDFFDLPGTKPRYALCFFFVGFLSAGYVMGSNHQRILSCEDFDFLGAPVPEDCTPSQPDLV